MIACTISGGDPHAGVMGPTHYAKWRPINKQLALVAPNLSVRTEGDEQAQASTHHLYTGRVIASAPILTMTSKQRPVIDLGSLCTIQASRFFGRYAFSGLDIKLASLTKAKAFPMNIIFEHEAPRINGQIVRLTYSFSKLEGAKDYKPRKADPRVGYFYNWHQDYARTSSEEVMDRYINRWNVQKADPTLKLSPPKKPIVWYIEHTTPIRFRRYVKEGILLWNEAFREIGLIDAVVVYQQDAETGAHMDKDPEDARYNFFRWNASNERYAIGPSRSDPRTGEILDADIVWHQGLTRVMHEQFGSLSSEEAVQTLSPETLAWLEDHPNWDPRVRLATPARREQILLQRRAGVKRAPLEDHAIEQHPSTHAFHNPTDAACRIGSMLALQSGLVDAAVAAGVLESSGQDQLDGLPESYIGAMIRYVSAHEVGHCLGLQHNMAASSVQSLEAINSEGFRGPTVGSVMDYTAVNINHELGEVQGPYATPVLGPYDKWAIAYGYGPEDKLGVVLRQVANPENLFISPLAMSVASDPRNATWDIGANNLNFSQSRLSLIRGLRGQLIEKIIEDGTSWKRARDRFRALLNTQLYAMIHASAWVGGSYINNDFKGDPGNRPPIEDVAASDQRRALNLMIENSFEDDAFGLTPKIVRYLGREYWRDPGALGQMRDDPSYNVHDVVGGIQAMTLTFLMNPTTLRRVYDNEYRVQNDAGDRFTLVELMTTITDAAWSECVDATDHRRSSQKSLISSFRRNLQCEHLQRLVDLSLLKDAASPALRTITSLATQELRRIDKLAEKTEASSSDPYTVAHLKNIRARIRKALDVVYVHPR